MIEGSGSVPRTNGSPDPGGPKTCGSGSATLLERGEGGNFLGLKKIGEVTVWFLVIFILALPVDISAF